MTKYPMITIVLVGFGEVGVGVYQWLKHQYAIQIHDPDKGYLADGNYQLMLVAIPYNDNFVNIVKEYQNKFQPEHTIVFSSVAVGTCSQLQAIHSPVEGKHPNLDGYLKKGTRFIGGDKDDFAYQFFEPVVSGIIALPKAEHTEFLKLRSTTLYGLNIEFARYTAKIAEELGLHYTWVKEYDNDYNKTYEDLGFPEYKRYILTPPEGKIGGHCVIPNAKILFKQYPDPLLKPLINNNE